MAPLTKIQLPDTDSKFTLAAGIFFLLGLVLFAIASFMTFQSESDTKKLQRQVNEVQLINTRYQLRVDSLNRIVDSQRLRNKELTEWLAASDTLIAQQARNYYKLEADYEKRISSHSTRTASEIARLLTEYYQRNRR